MTGLPTGTVTFLFTDIEGSTGLLHRLGGRRYAEVLAEHRRLLREAFAKGQGLEIDTQGDAFLVAAEERGNSRTVHKCLAGVAAASAEARPEWAATLFGAAEALLVAAGRRLELFNRRDIDHYMAVVWDKLGERACNAALAEGQRMTLEQAIEFALREERGDN